GSYAVEQLTDELEASIWSLMEDIESRGGALEAIGSGRFARDLAEAAYQHSQAVESGERVVVGVNRFPAETEPLEVFEIDPGTEAAQAESVRRLRQTRDQAAVDAALARLAGDVAAGRSVMPA